LTTDAMTPAFSPEGIDWERKIGDSAAVLFRFREIRLERTGWHAMVAVFLNKALLESDTFNIRRREDRIRLGNQAHAKMGNVAKLAYPPERLAHDLQVACLQTPDLWENQSIRVDQFGEDEQVTPIRFVLRPFIVDGGGTILFAPPGSGKSYVLQAWAMCVSLGIGTLWDCAERPVLYINLERSNGLMRNREAALRAALGLVGATGVKYLDGRGLSLRAVARKAQSLLKDLDNPVVFLDSISRAGAGSLSEDQPANQIINLLNGIAPTWCAIGHTTKAEGNNADHTFGSIHFVAGCDVEVKLAAEKIPLGLGLGLSITKANDIGSYPTEHLALEFGAPDSPITNMRRATDSEVATMSLNRPGKTSEDIEQYVEENQPVDATTISQALNANRGRVADYLKNSGLFVLVRRDGGPGGKALYGMKAREDHI